MIDLKTIGRWVQDGRYELNERNSAELSAWERQQKTNELTLKFKAEAIEAAGIKGHPKADLAFEIAWEFGHQMSLLGVLKHLGQLARLLV